MYIYVFKVLGICIKYRCIKYISCYLFKKNQQTVSAGSNVLRSQRYGSYSIEVGGGFLSSVKYQLFKNFFKVLSWF